MVSSGLCLIGVHIWVCTLYHFTSSVEGGMAAGRHDATSDTHIGGMQCAQILVPCLEGIYCQG